MAAFRGSLRCSSAERLAVKRWAAVCGRPSVSFNGLFGGDAGTDLISLRFVEEKNIRRETVPRWDTCYPHRLRVEIHRGCTRLKP
jgi:hypothetical protein